MGPSKRSGGQSRFVPLWLGQTLSILGIRLTGFSLAVHVFQETGSVTSYALLGLATMLPTILLSPLAGVAADRLDRRTVLILASVGSSLAFLALFRLLAAGEAELWHFYLTATISAIFGAFVGPALQSSVTLLVGREHLARASGMVRMGFSIAQIVAPVLAGALLGVMELHGIVLLTFGSHLVNSVILLLIRFPRPPDTAAGEEARSAGDSLFAQNLFAWRFIRARPPLWRLMTLFVGASFVVGMVPVLLTPLVLSFAPPGVLGLVLSIAALGTLVGGILMSVWGGARESRVRLILSALSTMGLLLLLGGLRPSATLVASAAFLYMMGIPIVVSSSQAIWQSKVPPDIQGRVFAVSQLVSGASQPLAMAIAGPLADHVFEPLLLPGGALADSVGRVIGVGPGRGIALMLVGLGVLMLVQSIANFFSPVLRRIEEELPDAVTGEGEDGPRSPDRPARALGTLTTGSAATVALTLAAMAALLLAATRPPPVPDGAPPTEFSAERAVRHLERLASRPHPVGSAAHAEVRDYLLGELRALGLEIEVHHTTATRRVGNLVVMTRPVNVLARLPGTAGRAGSVLLVAHYDSVFGSPGASDNGAAVAALLETARALRQGPPLANDVILLFSDAEEVGLQGARSFLRHSWADDVAVILNFEARGHGGPVYMFQSGRDNAAWIPRFAAGAPRPLANSLLDQIYRRLPNDTDFTPFFEAGYAGFNFAFIEGLTHYHSPLDRPEAVEPGSIQHHGTYALGLTRYLGDLPLAVERRPPPGPDGETGDNRAYFDIASRVLVHYPQALGWVFVTGAGLALLALLAAGLRRGRITAFGLWKGFLAFLGQIVAIPVIFTLVWLVVRDVTDLPILSASTPGAGWFMLAFTLLATAALGAIHRFLNTFIATLDLAAGTLLWWLVLAVLTSGPLLPVDCNFLFVWPLAGAMVAFAYLVRHEPGAQSSGALVAMLVVSALPAFVLLVPFLMTLYVGLQGLNQLGGLALIVLVLLTGLLVPHQELLDRAWKRWPAAVAVLGGTLLAFAVWRPGSPGDVRPSSVIYAQDADSGESRWFSLEAEPDDWSRHLGFGAVPDKESIEPYLPWLQQELASAPAPPLGVPGPGLEIVGQRREGPLRLIEMRLRPAEGASGRLLSFEPASAVGVARLGDFDVSLYGLEDYETSVIMELPLREETETLVLRVRGEDTVTVTVIEQHEGLPEAAGVEPRPPEFLPRYLMLMARSDVSLVRRSVRVAAPAPATSGR